MSYVCAEDLPPYGINNCSDYKASGISAYAVVKRGQTTITDWSNPAEWETAIANGDAVIAKGVGIDLADGAPINVDNRAHCGPAQLQVKVDYTATVQDQNVSEENDTFYSTINGKIYDIVLYYCDQEEIRVMPNASVSARIPTSTGNGGDLQFYNATFAWRYANDNFGTYATAPAGIFTE